MLRAAVASVLIVFCLSTGCVDAKKKKTVHLVANTHDDTGWLKTVDQYYWGTNTSIYEASVREIIETVIGALLQHPSRKFTYVEMAFFSRYWQELKSEQSRDLVRMLVREGRLQFANGGWCMHDEATPYYIDMVDQTTLGHRFLLEELGAVPKVGWQVDPFGHSATHAWLTCAKAGFDGLFFGRADYQDWIYRADHKNREFIWQGAASLPDIRLFTGVLLNNHYSAPQGLSWNFPKTPAIVADADLGNGWTNAKQWMQRFQDQATKDFTQTKGDDIMWTMGEDFAYQNAARYFLNLDQLINAVNAQEDSPFRAIYSTPHDYALAKLNSTDSNGHPIQWSNYSGDFFPYDDSSNGHAFWTGFYTSRPALKRYVRKASGYYTVTRQIRALTNSLPSTHWAPSLGASIALAQHHDAVSGTAKQHVAFDYAQRIARGAELEFPGTASALKSLVGLKNESTINYCWLSNISECNSTRALSSHPVKLVLWNGLGRSRKNATIRFPVPINGVKVTHNGKALPITVQESPKRVTGYSQTNAKSMPYEAAVLVPSVPALGFVLLQVEAAPTSVETPKLADPTGLENVFLKVEFAGQGGWISSITNKVKGHNASTYVKHSWCYYNSNTGNGEGGSYQASGAYIFRPQSSTCNPIGDPATSTVKRISTFGSNGEVLQGYERNLTDWLSERLLLGAHDRFLTHQFTVGAIPVDQQSLVGKEVVYRVETFDSESFNASGIKSDSTFYTDSNGREVLRRKYNTRQYPFTQTEPVAGNYFPVTAMTFMNDTKSQFTILTDSSVGASGALQDSDGKLEVMVHRRCLKDDGRGVGEPLDETQSISPYNSNDFDCWADPHGCGQHYGPGLIVRGEHWWTLEASAEGNPSHINRPLQDEKYVDLQQFWVDGDTTSGASTERGFLGATELPDAISLMTLQQLNASTLLLRISHQFSSADGMLPNDARANKIEVDIYSLVAETAFTKSFGAVAQLIETTLTTNQAINVNSPSKVKISPMDVRTFILTTDVPHDGGGRGTPSPDSTNGTPSPDSTNGTPSPDSTNGSPSPNGSSSGSSHKSHAKTVVIIVLCLLIVAALIGAAVNTVIKRRRREQQSPTVWNTRQHYSESDADEADGLN